MLEEVPAAADGSTSGIDVARPATDWEGSAGVPNEVTALFE
jgi:hypothetical protein